MKKRILGTGLGVSAVGLGCMGMSHAYGAPADRKEMTELLAKAVDMGYTFSIRRRFMELRSIPMIMKNWWGRH